MLNSTSGIGADLEVAEKIIEQSNEQWRRFQDPSGRYPMSRTRQGEVCYTPKELEEYLEVCDSIIGSLQAVLDKFALRPEIADLPDQDSKGKLIVALKEMKEAYDELNGVLSETKNKALQKLQSCNQERVQETLVQRILIKLNNILIELNHQFQYHLEAFERFARDLANVAELDPQRWLKGVEESWGKWEEAGRCLELLDSSKPKHLLGYMKYLTYKVGIDPFPAELKMCDFEVIQQTPSQNLQSASAKEAWVEQMSALNLKS